MRILKLPPLSTLGNHAVDYPTPVNLSYWWGYGSLAGIFLVVQLITGIFLAIHYASHVDLAFASVEHIIRDVNNGWLLRYIHANGASIFFLVVYIHLFRGLYYGSYIRPRAITWVVGVVILVLIIATAFIGYVLPWGQISFWAATVITNLFSAIPWVGESIVQLLWGGFSVDNATLNRFFSLHYLLPFVLVGAVLVHLIALHTQGSSNPGGLPFAGDKIAFYPYFWAKDVAGWLGFLAIYFVIVFYYPNVLGHSDNYIPANPIVTPAHIVPEWYFLPLYAVLRSIPDKLGGVIAIFGAIIALAVLPFVTAGTNIRSSLFRNVHRVFYWILVVDWVVLGWIGGKIPESPFLEVGQFATLYYFGYILVIVPALSRLEIYLIQDLLYGNETTSDAAAFGGKLAIPTTPAQYVRVPVIEATHHSSHIISKVAARR